jgi:hypothetical protein
MEGFCRSRAQSLRSGALWLCSSPDFIADSANAFAVAAEA